MPAAKRKEIVKGFAVWTKAGSSKVWLEAGHKWAGYIVAGKGWSLAEVIIKLAPYGVGFLFLAVAKWHGKKLKPYLGPKGIWVGIDPTRFVGKPENSLQWWKNVDARPRNAANMKQEPMPW